LAPINERSERGYSQPDVSAPGALQKGGCGVRNPTLCRQAV
jgi:hypothetical protein